VNNFVRQHPEFKIQVLTESERKGKSAALNFALKRCEGDVIIVSDADCFWPSDILNKALSFLADPNVGAISGPKVLLNPEQSWVTKTEDAYLNSANLIKLGESKIGSTLLFEGGFSAYKKEVIEAFDPYNTGSDDSGTIIKIVEKNARAMFVPEAKFFSAFPATWKGKMGLKTRRANQLVRVFGRYTTLLLGKRIKNSKRVISQNVLVYLFSPVMFILLLITTIPLLLIFPYFVAIFLVFLIPKVNTYLFEAVQSYFVLFLTIFSIAFGKKTVIWDKPEDRDLVTEDMLRQRMLI
jgi:cellulose synthase/poly-beta-1,6-N-acetylglucosamine synthase-like glycosyltransferase